MPIKAHTLLPATLISKDPFTAGLTSTTSAPLIPTSLKALTTLTDRVLKHPQLVHRSIVTSAEPAGAGAALDTPLADTLGAPPFFADPFFATIPRQFPSTYPAVKIFAPKCRGSCGSVGADRSGTCPEGGACQRDDAFRSRSDIGRDDGEDGASAPLGA